MLFCKKRKDGGSKSNVDGYFLVEAKSLMSAVLLKFNKGAREEFHSHAFDALTWFISGSLVEEDVDGSTKRYARSILPKVTRKNKVHRVIADKDSWCFSIRGPWVSKWVEISSDKKTKITLTHGRTVVSKAPVQ